MTDDEDPFLWLESHVNPLIPSPNVHAAYEAAAQAARMQHFSRQQQQIQQDYQQHYTQLQAGSAFEENPLRPYDGAQVIAPYHSGQPVTTGESGRHSMRPSNREVLNPQCVRPLVIGPSFPTYQPNTSRRAILPYPASYRPPSGAMQASRPSDHKAQRSSLTSNYARQECGSATPMQNRLPLLREQYGGHQNQPPASARPTNQSIPASMSPKGLGASKPHSQTTSVPIPRMPQQPPVMPGQNNPKISSSVPCSNPSRSPYTAQAPVAAGAAPPSATPSGFISLGQQPSNKMRRLDDGSKHDRAMNTKENMRRAKQVSKSEIQRLDIVRPLDVNDIAMKDSYDVATIARDVLITAGKHPSEEVLNHHLHALMKAIPVVDHSSDLATLRWDGIDPLIYARDNRPRNASTRPPGQPIDATSAVAYPSFHSNSLPAQWSSLPSLSQNSHPVDPNTSVPPPPPIPSTPVPAPERTPSKPQAVTKTPTTNLSSTPRSKIPSASPQAAPPAQSIRAKEYSQPHVVIGSSLHKMPPIKKRPGRPKKDTKSDNVATTSPGTCEPPIQFAVFKCLWKYCQTELHSLVLLQQHVLKAHIPHNITCGWKECDNSTPMAASAMWEHLRDTHFKDYAWALGDGPAVPSPGEGDQDESPFVPQFDLFDRQARPATVLLPLDDCVVAGYSKSHGIKNSRQRAELFKEAGCRWKEEAGPDVDISDRMLSTPPRQVTSRLVEMAMTQSESP